MTGSFTVHSFVCMIAVLSMHLCAELHCLDLIFYLVECCDNLVPCSDLSDFKIVHLKSACDTLLCAL